MPLIYGPTEMTNPQPKNFVTPSRTTGIYVQNVSPLALIITSGLGSIELPPWQTATLEMMPNDNMNVSAIPITAVPPTLAAYAYVDISYTFQGVTVQGSGLFFPFMTPAGDAVAAGIMGPDGLQVGTSTSNPNGSSLLVQATGSNPTGPTQILQLPYTDWNVASMTLYTSINAKLSRQAKSRVLYAVNTMDQNITFTAFVQDSTNPATLGAAGGDSVSGVTLQNKGSNSSTINTIDSGTHPALGAPGDSLALHLGVGATLPTMGNLTFYLVERPY